MSKYDDVLKPFAQMMEKELHANAGKGDRPGWLSMSTDTCLLEIIYHFGKLQASVKRGDIEGITEYAADVANMSMMLVDICGALPAQEQDNSETDQLKAENESLRQSGAKWKQGSLDGTADVYRLSCELAQRTGEVRELAGVVDDLCALTKRFVQHLSKAAPGNDLSEKALDYLTRKGLQGCPMRARIEGASHD
jgi:hypothetical protein